MEGRTVKAWLSLALVMCALAGCKQAPEAVEDEGILHAKSSVEQDVERLVETESGKMDTVGESTGLGGWYDAVVGTKENGIWICAQVPDIPQNVYQITLREKKDLSGDILEELLDSRTGKVTDMTEKILAEEKEKRSKMNKDEIVSWVDFGDDSFLAFSDGEREASFSGNTSVYYENKIWKKNCDAIYKIAPEINIPMDDKKNEKQAVKKGAGKDEKKAVSERSKSLSFSAARAKKTLLQKLKVLGISEICLYQTSYYEQNGTAFYEMEFVPSYEDIGVAHEFGQEVSGEIRPRGTAWIMKKGVALLSLENFLGEITEKEEAEKILDFSRVTGVLERYLESNTLCGLSRGKLTRVEFVYYPTYHKPELLLAPAWHIYIPLSEYVESEDKVYQEMFEKSAAHNIYIHAVTGELLKVE